MSLRFTINKYYKYDTHFTIVIAIFLWYGYYQAVSMSCECNFTDSSHLTTSCGSSANITLFMSLVDLMVRSNCAIADPCRRASTINFTETRIPDEYDFIVVGGGVAGSIVASRLSEVRHWKVLLLEAGPEEPTTTSVPAFAITAIGTHLDWQYKTEPQTNACRDNGGVCNWPRGKMIAGTGAMTGLMYTRGHKDIFDNWARDGNTGWSYAECLPYFIMSENNKNPELVDEGYHGTSGPITVQQFTHHPEFAEDIVAAGLELGYRTGDLNGRNQTGFAIAQMMVDDGLRASTARMYLRPAYNRDNLIVSINSHVTKIIIDPTTKTATGVQFQDNEGSTHTARARKEIILSAGAVGSPHLLLLSGIGPRRELEKHGIPVIQDLKVGHNLHNHVAINIGFLVNDTNRRSLTMHAVKQFLTQRNGPMASTGLTQTTAFMRTKHTTDDIPDLQIFFDGFSAQCSESGMEEECSDGTFKTSCGKRYINARPTNVMTKSKGYLTLKSTDPFDYPAIYANYLSDDNDVKVLIEGIKQIVALTRTAPLRKWGMEIIKTPEKGCEGFEFMSDGYWECVIRTSTGPENHQAGTCKMGPVGDATAVIDPELRVHGIPNLRVIDASIFPLVPNSNPVAAISMAAEKGSVMIRAAWIQQDSELAENSTN